MKKPRAIFRITFPLASSGLGCLILVLLLAVSASAQTLDRPEFTGIRVGFGNHYKAGLWTPVELKIRGGAVPLTGQVSVVVPDGDGVPSQVVTPPSKPIQVLPGRETSVQLCVRFGRVRSDLRAEFLVDGKAAAEKTFTASLQADEDSFLEALEEQPLYVVVGNSNMGLEEALKLRETASSEANGVGEFQPEIARITDVEQLPVEWCGYEGVDALLISTSNPDLFRKLGPDNARIKALDEWIRLGGRLVLCVGAEANVVLAENAPLAGFAPGRMETIVTRDQTAAWEQFCGSSMPVPQPKGGGKLTIRCPKLMVSEGIEARENDLPLVVRTPRGFGQILFVAADIDRPPFSKWNERGLLLAKLLDFSVSRGNEKQAGQYQGGYGYADLSGQLRSALDAFTGVTVVPFALVAMLIVGYILLIGPGDYFLLKKLLRRMEWTWFTFPVIVLVVGLSAYWLAYYLKGNQLRVNQVDLIDVDVAGKSVRGTTWLNIFSPRMESFDLSLRPMPPGKLADSKAADSAAGYFAWFGLPGSGLGGMNPHGGGNTSLFSTPYRLWSEARLKPPAASSIEGVPIQVWSTKSFTGRWRADAEVVPRGDLYLEQQDLFGTIANPYDFPLMNCIVAQDRWAYELGTIEPGKTAELGLHLKRNDLKNYLTGYHMVKEGNLASRQETTSFEMYNRDAPYILRMMMFYEAAGGRGYAHIANDYQSFVDLSNMLKTGRAILVADALQNAAAKDQGATLLRKDAPVAGGGERHTVIFRFIFPVTKK